LYYADTYALIEILRGNPNYRKYTALITSEFNLLELAYALVRDFDEETALNTLREVRRAVPVVKPSDEDYVEAAKLRLTFKKRNLSLIDALGYTIAKNLKVKFLTGDKQFEDLENVEYVK
jgi:predicted nucleic acid-binding protein